MSEGNQDNAEYKDLPKWQQDISIADRALDVIGTELYLEEVKIRDKHPFATQTTSTLDAVRDHLPEYILFDSEKYNRDKSNQTLRLAFPSSVRKYYLPKTHEIFTIEGSSLGKPQAPQSYPENADFIGFDELRKNLPHSNLHIVEIGIEVKPGVFVRRLDVERKSQTLGGLPVTTNSLYPGESENLIAAAKKLLEQEIGNSKTEEALAEINKLFQRYHVDTKELYESFAPNIRKRLLNQRDSILRSPYGNRLPRVLEINRYSNDPEFHSYYFIVGEGKLVKSDTPPKRNLFRRIKNVMDVTEATDEEFVTYSRRVQFGLTSVLPSGWGLWGKSDKVG